MTVQPVLLRCIVAIFAAVCANVSYGQADPYSLGISQTVSYQSNVFLVPNGEPKINDFIASTGLTMGVNQVTDIHRYFLNFNAQSNTYQDTKVLNNPTYTLNAGIESNAERWVTILGVSANQQLGDYATPNVAQITEKNIQNTEEVGLSLRYASTPRVGLGGGVAYQWSSFSAAAFESQESSQGAAFLAITYQVNPVLQLGVGPRWTKGSSPKYETVETTGAFIPDDFDGRYVDLLAAWQLTPDSNLSAGVSLTRVTHSIATQLDYSGLTGFLGWSYRLGGKLGFSASFVQGTGLGGLSGTSSLLGTPRTGSTGAGQSGGAGTPTSGGGTGLTTGSSTAVNSGGGGGTAGDAVSANSVSNNRLNRALSLGAVYALGAKTDVSAGIVVNNGYIANASAATGVVRTTALAFGIAYAPTEPLSVFCNLGWSRQSANQSAELSGQAHSYSASTASCTVQYTLH